MRRRQTPSNSLFSGRLAETSINLERMRYFCFAFAGHTWRTLAAHCSFCIRSSVIHLHVWVRPAGVWWCLRWIHFNAEFSTRSHRIRRKMPMWPFACFVIQKNWMFANAQRKWMRFSNYSRSSDYRLAKTEFAYAFSLFLSFFIAYKIPLHRTPHASDIRFFAATAAFNCLFELY